MGVKMLCPLRCGNFLMAESVLSRGGLIGRSSMLDSLRDGGWGSMDRRS